MSTSRPARLRRGLPRTGWIAVGGLTLLVTLAILAPIVAPDPTQTSNLDALLEAPSLGHPFGTDDLGRDLFSRWLFAMRMSLLSSLLCVAVALVIGVVLGAISGYFGGFLDSVTMRLTDAIISVPGLLIVMVIIGIIGPGIVRAMTALGIAFSPVFIRLVRGEVSRVKSTLYVEAAKTTGVSERTIIVRHIMPNVASPVIIQSSLVMGYALLMEGALSYLGLSVQPPTPSWGIMLKRATAFVDQQPWGVLVSGGSIVLAVVLFNALGDALRDSLMVDGGRATR